MSRIIKDAQIGRISRNINNGYRQLQNYKQKAVAEKPLGTFYLLPDGKILSYREYHWANSPKYRLSGTLEGLKAYKIRNPSLK